MNGYLLSILIGASVLGAMCAGIGVFNNLLKRPLIADSIAHATLPGIALGFLWAGEKNLWILFLGACTSAWLSLLFTDWLKLKSKLKNDSILAISLGSFFSIGLCIISYIQNQGSGQQTGLQSYLFGNASSLSLFEIQVAGTLLLITLVVFLLFWRRLQLFLFHPEFAQSIGLHVPYFTFFVSFVTVLAVALSVKAMGIVLASALLISPVLAAKYWRLSFRQLFGVSVLVGACAAFLGAYASFSWAKTPTGSAIVFVLFGMVFSSVLFGNQGGVIQEKIKAYRRRQKISAENVLKLFFYAKGELVNNQGQNRQFHYRSLLETGRLSAEELQEGLRLLCRNKRIAKKGMFYELNHAAWEACISLVRRHRLWELYLSEQLNLDKSHVHQDAEMAEHWINERMENELLRLLKNPKNDPHQKQIP